AAEAFVEVPAAAMHGDDTWEPVPVPVPTYVNAPVAQSQGAQSQGAQRAQPPIIDLTRPGQWSSEHSGALFTDDDTDLFFDQMSGESDDLDEIVERRRAVGD